MADQLGVPHKASSLASILEGLYRCFTERDCLDLSLNPVVLTDSCELTTLGCKVEIDDSAVFRQQELFAMLDYSQMTYQERCAKLADLLYIALEGNIGVISNSAGECMAINDFIQQVGGRPGNFLDLGGQAYHEQIEEMIYLQNGDPQIKVILINCFGGALNVDKVASSLAILFNLGVEFSKPIVCRLRGEGEEVARQKLAMINYDKLHVVDDYEQAVILAVKLANQK